MIKLIPTRFAAFILPLSIVDRCSTRWMGRPLRRAVWLAGLCIPLAAPAWGQEIGAPRTLLWLTDFAAPLGTSQGDSASASEQVTMDEAIALALDANRLAKNPERRRFVAESVIQAYNAVRRAQRALEIREEALRMCRDLDRRMVELADRHDAAPSVVRAGAARESATSDVLSARQDLDAWTRALNHLMGRDPQARLLVTGEPGPTPSATARLNAIATCK